MSRKTYPTFLAVVITVGMMFGAAPAARADVPDDPIPDAASLTVVGPAPEVIRAPAHHSCTEWSGHRCPSWLMLLMVPLMESRLIFCVPFESERWRICEADSSHRNRPPNDR